MKASTKKDFSPTVKTQTAKKKYQVIVTDLNDTQLYADIIEAETVSDALRKSAYGAGGQT